MDRVGIIGTGVVGSALALLLGEKGYKITAVFSKSGASAAKLAAELGCRQASSAEEVVSLAKIIFLTTPDRVIGSLAAELRKTNTVLRGKTFFHMSGAFPAEELKPLSESGAAIGSIHPLQSFASTEVAIQNLPGSFYALQGDEEALALAVEIVDKLGGKSFKIRKEDKPLYHMGASVASNYLVALIDYAINIYQHIGMKPEEALGALLPLIRGTLTNIEKLGTVQALTGPIARGDAETIKGHLRAAGHLDQELVDLYRNLGLYTVKVAEKKGTIDGTGAEILNTILRKDGD